MYNYYPVYHVRAPVPSGYAPAPEVQWGWHHPVAYPVPYYARQMPEVDPTLFNESAVEMQKLLHDASTVLKSLAQSKSFAKKVMAAAQESHKEEVERLIESTGIQSKVETTFNPDGINLKMKSNVGDAECCKLTIALRWR